MASIKFVTATARTSTQDKAYFIASKTGETPTEVMERVGITKDGKLVSTKDIEWKLTEKDNEILSEAEKTLTYDYPENIHESGLADSVREAIALVKSAVETGAQKIKKDHLRAQVLFAAEQAINGWLNPESPAFMFGKGAFNEYQRKNSGLTFAPRDTPKASAETPETPAEVESF